MAALYGRVQGERGEATRIAHRTITARVETWEGEVKVDLAADGEYTVFVGPKGGARCVVALGNVNTPEGRTGAQSAAF